jgi:uncharacterized protein
MPVEKQQNAFLRFIRRRSSDLWLAIQTAPTTGWKAWLPCVLMYAAIALSIGFASGVYSVQLLDIEKFWFLPVTLLLFPSIPEELFFRGLLIPRDCQGWNRRTAFYIILSATAFTLWHPLNAMTINPTAQPFFLDLAFLVIVLLLGVTCALSYILSKSFWVPVGIHWLTVVIWVILLGGRNLVLEG